jgi:hypothetical protein
VCVCVCVGVLVSRNVCTSVPTAFVAEWLRRYVQVVVLSEGAGSSPVECIFFGLGRQCHDYRHRAFLAEWLRR